MSRLGLILAGAMMVLVVLLPWDAVGAEKKTAEHPVVFSDDFENGADRWDPVDPAAWRVVEKKRGKVYNQFKKSKYKPPHRSPYNISLVKDVVVGDFTLTAKVKSTNPKGGAHQDMCVFFGYQDSAHFYYVHLGKRSDPRSSQVTIVNGADREKITTNETPGIPWDKKWHTVKVVRRVADGTIEIYFDDMKKPNMIASDKTFTWGRVGLGSFDDHGHWDDVELRGVKVQKPKGTKKPS